MFKSPPPPKPKSLFRPVAWFTLGMLIFGIVAFLGFNGIESLPFSTNQTPRIVVAVASLGLLLGLTVFLMWTKRIAFASGILISYVVVTIISGGQCTLWVASKDYSFIVGFFLYLFALAVAFGLAMIALIADAIRSTLN